MLQRICCRSFITIIVLLHDITIVKDYIIYIIYYITDANEQINKIATNNKLCSVKIQTNIQ